MIVTGGAGKLATALRPYFPQAEFPTRDELDVANLGSCRRYFSTRSVDCIVHLAAETAHDAPYESYVVNNIVGTANITLWAGKLGVRLVYTSTDYVYAGTTGHYTETDLCSPVNDYARSKYAGESIVATLANTLIVRGSWYSRLEYHAAAIDAFSSRLPVTEAAFYLAGLVSSDHTGIVNLGGPRRSLYEIIATEFYQNIKPSYRSELKLAYPLPADTSLNTEKLRRWMTS